MAKSVATRSESKVKKLKLDTVLDMDDRIHIVVVFFFFFALILIIYMKRDKVDQLAEVL